MLNYVLLSSKLDQKSKIKKKFELALYSRFSPCVRPSVRPSVSHTFYIFVFFSQNARQNLFIFGM